MYSVGNLAVEASTLIFDPYKLTATGLPNKCCYVAGQPSYDQENFQDMNQVTRRGTLALFMTKPCANPKKNQAGAKAFAEPAGLFRVYRYPPGERHRGRKRAREGADG
jgi:hypothetical protein